MIGGPPKIGWVVRYSYDWGVPDDEAPRLEKDRPVVVLLAVTRLGSSTRVRVAPITRRIPADPGLAVEIPANVKKRLGLDDQRSWLVLDHTNEFVWPGFDLRAVPGRYPQTIYYGALPPGLYERAKQILASLIRARLARVRLRDE